MQKYLWEVYMKRRKNFECQTDEKAQSKISSGVAITAICTVTNIITHLRAKALTHKLCSQ